MNKELHYFIVMVGIAILFCLAVGVIKMPSDKEESKQLSNCKPNPGQCAFDGAGVYCLIPATVQAKPLRNGEKNDGNK